MHFVFVCPGMPFNGDFVEKGLSLGGSETACYYVARGVAALGHKVLVFTNDQKAEGKHHGVDYCWAGPQSERWPVGEYAQNYIETTPNDVLVLQRAPGIHRAPPQVKVALWWLHDLALRRAAGAARLDLFNYDGVLAVSDWHRKQIADTWDLEPNNIWVVPNSVDREHYKQSGAPRRDRDYNSELRLLYQSRFERGVDYLVAPNGIMEKLLERRPGARMFFCGYDNSPAHMEGYYRQVRARIEELPNCTWLGTLSKGDLARLQESCDMLVYPGEFEETSCITAMEAQAAGLPMLASATGALPETCRGGGAHLVPLREGRCNQGEFVNFIANANRTQLQKLAERQLAVASRLDWMHSARKLEEVVHSVIAKKQRNRFSMIRTMIDKSDIMLATQFTDQLSHEDPDSLEAIAPEMAEINRHYAFARSPDAMREHYDSDAAVADIERSESLDVRTNPRFQESRGFLLQERPKRILDYGCQKGHYAWSLAQDYKEAAYVGVDVSPRVIDWAHKHCKVEGVDIKFATLDVLSPGWSPESALDFVESMGGRFDAIMLGEVLEHVPDPHELLRRLTPFMAPRCRVVISTPFGDWEGKDYTTAPDRDRYHMHHFDRRDLDEMFSHHEGYLVGCVPAGRSTRWSVGSFVTTFIHDPTAEICGRVNYARKLKEYAPRDTVSLCMLARNSESTVLRSLMTTKDVADEVIIALDSTTTDGTRLVLEKFAREFMGDRRFVILDADSPLDIGFDEARNRTVEQARGDWIMWIDCDEDMVYPERLVKYLKHNMYDGYGIAQHHMATDPVGVLTTDWPVRVFRNKPYLRFQGVVHEHPDDMENPNTGPRRPAQLVDMHIVHHGYTTEPVRRDRFQRNLPLIKRDRAQYPNRTLGRLLWIRDLAHQVMFELEQTQGRPTDNCFEYARQGLVEWEELLKQRGLPIVDRMIRDGLDFYSNLVRVTGQGFEVDFQIHAAKGNFADSSKTPRRRGCFMNREHLDIYMKLCADEHIKPFEGAYF